MQIKSSAFKNEESIPEKYTCDSENINPPLQFSDVPERAKSLVLIVDDPDAPAGTWVHWTIWNIDPQTTEIVENSVPEGAVEGMTDFGTTGYGGPCPPSGVHRYFFKLYALDSEIELPSGVKLEELEEAMAGQVIAKAQLMGTYSKK